MTITSDSTGQRTAPDWRRSRRRALTDRVTVGTLAVYVGGLLGLLVLWPPLYLLFVPDRGRLLESRVAEATVNTAVIGVASETGSVKKAGQRWRVRDWLTHWIDSIAIPPRVTVNTHDGYRIDVERHLIPGVGAHWLDRLEPEHLERLYVKMQDAGLAAGTAHHVHRTIRNALNEAVRRGHLARNPAVLAKAPNVSEEEVEPYEVPEVQRLLEAASNVATAHVGRSHSR